MASITTRAGKGSPLTHAEVDANFNNLNNGKLDISTAPAGSITVDSSGRVGIGTASPIGKVDITGTSVPLILQSTVAAANYITHRHVTSGDIAYIGNGGGGALTAGTTSDYAIRANLGSLIFACNGDNERARIDSSGRLLVGTSTTSASTRLVVQGSSAGSGSPAIQHLCFDGATPASGDGLGFLIFGDNTQSQGAWITARRDGGTWSGSSKPSRLEFSTTADGASSPTERMRIGNDGVTNTFSSGSSNFVPRSSAAANTSNFFIQGCYGATNTQNGTVSFQVFTNGNVQNTNNSYAGISDVKLKENIVDATSQWSDVKALQVRKYNFKEGQTHTQIGLIAQEVELVSPGLVTESPDRDEDGNDLGTVTKSVNYSVLYMKAVKALQEAMERIETLEAKVAALEASS